MRQVASGKSIDVSPTYHEIELRSNRESDQIHLGKKNCVDLWVVLKLVENPHPLDLTCSAMDERLAKAFCICLYNCAHVRARS